MHSRTRDQVAGRPIGAAKSRTGPGSGSGAACLELRTLAAQWIAPGRLRASDQVKGLLCPPRAAPLQSPSEPNQQLAVAAQLIRSPIAATMASAHTGPFPSAQATESYWRSAPLPIDTHRSTEALPAHADVVIIGAGYSGTSVAHHLLAESQRAGRAAPSIVILEAREACSGATGRNGACVSDLPL